MFKKALGYSSVLLMVSLLVACGTDEEVKNLDAKKTFTATPKGKKVEGKWYTSAQLIRGKRVFAANCAVCHGANGEGLVTDWKKPGADGKFPAPPLNGTAHTWHHSKELLMRTVNEGGIALGGTMLPFKDKLNKKEKEAVLAHVMSLWPKEIYDTWKKRNPATK